MATKINIILALEGLQKMSAGLGRAARGVDGFNRGMAGARNAALGVIGALGAMGAASVNEASKLATSLSEVEAKSGATADQLAMLKQQAIDLGSNTKFSAKEAADGMIFLAQAGFDAQQIYDALPSTLDLAASANMELADAADIVSNMMGQFQIEANETARVADVLAKTAASSNTDVAQLAEGMNYAGPAANAFGSSIEQTAALIGVLGNSGVQGSQAGTTLRSSFLRMAAPTLQVQRGLDALGVSVADSEGNMRDMVDILTDLGVAMEGVDQRTGLAAINDIFGKNAAAGALIAIEAARSGEVQALQVQLEGAAGAAQEMARTMADNLQGDVTSLQSALSGAGTAIGDVFLPIVREVTQWLTGLVRAFNGLDAETRQQIISFLIMAGAVAAGVLVISALGFVLAGVIALFSALGAVAAFAWALVFSPITLIILAIAAVAAAVILYWDEIKAAAQAVVDWFSRTFPNLADDLKAIWDSIKQAFAIAWEANKIIVQMWIKSVTTLFGVFWDWFSGRFPNLAAGVESAFKAVVDVLKAAFDSLREKIGGVIDWIQEKIDVVMEKVRSISGAFGKLRDAVPDFDMSNVSLPGFATGGAVRGPGSGTSDSIIARLSNGEFVIAARAVREYGLGFFHALNNLQMPKLATGGLVSPALMPPRSALSGLSFDDLSPASSGGGDTVIVQLGGKDYPLHGPRGVGQDLARELQAEDRRRLSRTRR